jgi:GcrA cell cycle regulator
MQLNWEEAHSVALREYAEKGMSFAEAARTLNQRFGTAYSRNAAIGRARRMGLCSPERAERVARPPKPAAVRLPKRRERAVSGSPARVEVRERAAALQLVALRSIRGTFH